jgi:hypothetical protein
MSAVPATPPAAPAATAPDLELEHAELLPARETLMIGPLYPSLQPGRSRASPSRSRPRHLA